MEEREGKLLQWCLPSFGFPLYIVKEVKETAQLNRQTARIILMCKQLVSCNRSHQTQQASPTEF